MSGTVVNIKHKESSIPEGGIERPCFRNFYPCKEILYKIKGFVENRLSRKNPDNEEKTQEKSESREQSSNKQSNKESCESSNEKITILHD